MSAGGGNELVALKPPSLKLSKVGDLEQTFKILCDHVGNVNHGASFDEALRKIEVWITGQTNQAISRHKLFTYRRRRQSQRQRLDFNVKTISRSASLKEVLTKVSGCSKKDSIPCLQYV